MIDLALTAGESFLRQQGATRIMGHRIVEIPGAGRVYFVRGHNGETSVRCMIAVDMVGNMRGPHKITRYEQKKLGAKCKREIRRRKKREAA